ncbi:restriction endonuclease subunit S [Adlercreutzia sp. ZJ473]|uniref:restriction endonuclease subunit S n=1 Tax=Adlercreutzia sp. ZJ473 TaxID=2722822 RepID=UPI0015518B3F|nr:restriction endonuclease subunit S [Adlercreutzia sp. ZJ473]
MDNWNEVVLESICNNNKKAIISGPFGSNISSKFFTEEGIPVIRGNNLSLGDSEFIDDGFVFITEEKAKKLDCWAVENDLVFTSAGTLGQVGIIPHESNYPAYVISNKQLRARVDDSIVLPKYAYYWFSTKWMISYFARNDIGSTVPLLTLSELKRAPIRYPVNLGDQFKIVQLIDTINDKIATNKKLIEELEETARLIHDYWFTQFDFPDENGKPYCSSGGKMVWSEDLKREIPDDWEVGVISDLGEIVSGATPSTKNSDYYTDHGIAWITPKDLSESGGKAFVSHGERDITQAGYDSCSAKMMPPGSVVMSSRAPIGYLAIASEQCCTNQGCKSFVANKGYSPLYIYLTLSRFMPVIESWGAGTTFSEVSKDSLADVKVVLPPKRLVEEFEASAKSLFHQIYVSEKQIDDLSAARNWLLPLLMNGQLVVE